MILRRLTIRNFRQFLGTQTIEFAPYGDHGEQNVTVVFGENGRGKTGIFRAIMFCLFGDRRLSQDGDISDSEIYLVNQSALEDEIGRPVEGFAELAFEHGGNRFVLKRAIRAVLRNGHPLEELSVMSLEVTDDRGNHTLLPPEEIGPQIAKILDKRVKEYFLFDGEKIERLTRADAAQRRELALGIRNLLKLDALENGLRATEKLSRELNDQVSNSTTTELGRLLNQLRHSEDTKLEKSQRLEEISKEVAKAASEIAVTDKELAMYVEINLTMLD